MNLFVTLEESSLATWLRTAPWGYPFAEAAHIFSFSLLVGVGLLLAVGLLRRQWRPRIAELRGALAVWLRVAALLAIVTGFFLFTTAATYYLRNPAFLSKMVVLLLILLDLRWQLQLLAGWRSKSEKEVRVAGAISLVGLPLLVTLGRLIAYV